MNGVDSYFGIGRCGDPVARGGFGLGDALVLDQKTEVFRVADRANRNR